jgi:hypothetical protein
MLLLCAPGVSSVGGSCCSQAGGDRTHPGQGGAADSLMQCKAKWRSNAGGAPGQGKVTPDLLMRCMTTGPAKCKVVLHNLKHYFDVVQSAAKNCGHGGAAGCLMHDGFSQCRVGDGSNPGTRYCCTCHWRSSRWCTCFVGKALQMVVLQVP